MYNGIGLTTPRGSGTNGYVQRNLANVSVKKYEDFKPVDSKSHAIFKKPNKEILEHERKRKIELKCVELEDLMEKQGYKQEEIEKKVNLYRDSLMEKHNEQMKNDDGTTIDEFEKDAGGRIKGKGTHEEALANSLKDKKFKEAMHITSDDEKNTSSIFDKSSKVVQKRKIEDDKTDVSEEEEKPKKKKSKKSKKSKAKNNDVDPLSIDDSSDDDTSKKKKSKKSRKHKKKDKKMKKKQDSIDSIESGQISESGPSRMNSHDQKDLPKNTREEQTDEKTKIFRKDQLIVSKELKEHLHKTESRKDDDDYHRKLEERDRALDKSRKSRDMASRLNEAEVRRSSVKDDPKMTELGSSVAINKSDREFRKEERRDDLLKSLEEIPHKVDHFNDDIHNDRNDRLRKERYEDRSSLKKDNRYSGKYNENDDMKHTTEDSKRGYRSGGKEETRYGDRDISKNDNRRDRSFVRDENRNDNRRRNEETGDRRRDERNIRRDEKKYNEIRRDDRPSGREKMRGDDRQVIRDDIRCDERYIDRAEIRRDDRHAGRDEIRKDDRQTGRNEARRDERQVEKDDIRRDNRPMGRNEERGDDRQVGRNETRRDDRQVGRNETRRDDRKVGRNEARRDDRQVGRNETRRDDRQVGKDHIIRDDRQAGCEESKRNDKNTGRDKNVCDDSFKNRDELKKEKVRGKKEDFEESSEQPVSYRISSIKEKDDKLRINRSENADIRNDSNIKKKSLSLTEKKSEHMKRRSRSSSSSSSSSSYSSSTSDSSSSSSN